MAWWLLVFGCMLARSAAAADPAWLARLADDDSATKLQAIDAPLASGDRDAVPVLRALLAGNLYIDEHKHVVIDRGEGYVDAVTGQALANAGDASLDKIAINNRLRGELELVIAAFSVGDELPFPQRLAAAHALRDAQDARFLPFIDRAIAQERDVAIRSLLIVAQAGVRLTSIDPQERRHAAAVLADAPSDDVKSLLLGRLAKDAQGNDVETDPGVRAQIQTSLGEIDARLHLAEYVDHVFAGLSLGSILLLAALGLAITFGLMGVINMAHGELLMIGAYATYAVQSLFKAYWPGAFDWYLAAAIPAAFLASAAVGALLERSVIRYLYGRPLETLLATWGLSLILIQSVRALFGAQNVEVANPAWLSGGIAAMPGLVLPYNRLAIIAFAFAVVVLVWLMLNRTRLGVMVRAATQNRGMAACIGVPTSYIDTMAFALGAGIAGLGGCALSQIGNVGPELGQGYIVDSFMVVVLGGVGQLAGTLIAALGLGEVSKLLEPQIGAVLAKILVLVFVIVFIQKRPQGLFALKGRAVEG